jgi:hypothetical protein
MMTPVFAVDTGTLAPDIGLMTANQNYAADCNTILTAIANHTGLATQKNETIVEEKGNTQLTAPGIVAACVNTNPDETCATNSPPDNAAAVICMNNDLNEKIDGKYFLMTAAVLTESSGGGLKTPVLCGVDTMGHDATIAASCLQGVCHGMIAGASSIDKAQGRFATDACSEHGIV